MRSIANSTIRLGLVNLPVQMCQAADTANDVTFKQAGPNGEKLRQAYLLPDGKECPREQMRKGVETGDTITLIDDNSLMVIAEQTKLPDLNVLQVIDRSEVQENLHRAQGRYFVQSQSPKKGGNYAAFKLFVDALEAEGKALVVKWTPRSRQTLMVIYPEGGNLVASAISFHGDLREPDESVEAHKSAVYGEAEMTMARQLICAMADSDGDVLTQAVDEAITLRATLVQDALAGKRVSAPAPVAPKASTGLLESLAASLAAVK